MLFKKSVIITTVFLLTTTLTACKKELTVDLTGSLRVEFVGAEEYEIYCNIYIGDYKDNFYLYSSIYPNNDKVLHVKDLNFGNYTLTWNPDPYVFGIGGRTVFQISPGKETKIKVDL